MEHPNQFASPSCKLCKLTPFFQFARAPLKGGSRVQTDSVQTGVQTDPERTP